LAENERAERKLILHDLEAEEAALYLPGGSGNITLFPAYPVIHDCIGCFGCWIKTPGQCVIDDRGREFGKLIPEHDAFVIVSKCVYGSLSPDVKLMLERNIFVSLPFFHIVNGEMHHEPRYSRMPSLSYHFYGSDIMATEKETAKKLIAANALNLYAPEYSVSFHSSISDIKEALV